MNMELNPKKLRNRKYMAVGVEARSNGSLGITKWQCVSCQLNCFKQAYNFSISKA